MEVNIVFLLIATYVYQLDQLKRYCRSSFLLYCLFIFETKSILLIQRRLNICQYIKNKQANSILENKYTYI